MDKRNKKYFCLGILIALEFTIVRIMETFGVMIQSEFANAIGTLLFILPIVVLLFYLNKDVRLKKHWRTIWGLLAIHCCLSFVAGIIASWFL